MKIKPTAYALRQRKMFANWIIRSRQSLGMSQAELGMRIGRTQPQIARMEQGNYNITLDNIAELARAFGMKMYFKPDDRLEQPNSANPDNDEVVFFDSPT